ncbi:hypothetical protein L249_7837 [Ophiocordyceps polyrhachis-furcata BCC 54312]|uniref:Uncharacterized protein n=1 Tax=Ophiocordyceps polyrhachis-furcata BCC 54312 TaxID=1330021 RepID=A0A367L0N0_9HYPO|nr:hypothetical protein L249_7837 [Ophiocordyceps polyrhachis-furcata BCC 54312]
MTSITVLPVPSSASSSSSSSSSSDGRPKQAETRTIPVHPIDSLQVAFTESLDEVTTGSIAAKPKLTRLDAQARRQELLSQAKDAPPPDLLWRYRTGQTQHELFKLLAQISFGVYLLLDGMANSNAQVMTILQSHIDDVDEYLQVTLQDISEATTDLNSRLDQLKTQLSSVDSFEKLLENRNFRRQILEANEKTDHDLCRTGVAMRQWDDDVAAGLKSITAFTTWLGRQDDDDDAPAAWRSQRADAAEVFDTMKGNAEGWLLAFEDVHRRADEVSSLVGRLTTVIAEMEKKAGEVSRRTWATIPPFTSPSPGGTRPSSSLRFQVPASTWQAPEANEETSATASLANASSDESLYVLQPRIYSPRIPEPLTVPSRRPSQARASSSMTKPASVRENAQPPTVDPPRQRASSSASALTDASNSRARSVAPRPTSRYATPRTALSQALDCVDVDGHSLRRGSDLSQSPPAPPVRPQMIHSPCSEQNQFYRPVLASPHSPLQQRPHTATGPPPGFQPILRKQPSQPGSTSTTKSNPYLAMDDSRVAAARPDHHQPLKKKKSAFGWFKKAFSLDDEERAQFQARRTMAQTDHYFDTTSPKFLDGRRIR